MIIPSSKESLVERSGQEGDILFTAYTIWCQSKINYFYWGTNTETEAKTAVMYDSSGRP